MGLSGVARGEDCSGLPARAICRRHQGVGYSWAARRVVANHVSLEGMPGAGLTFGACGQARSERLALKPYWGEPTVRNFRGGSGNVGIIRRPVRATALPDPLTGTQVGEHVETTDPPGSSGDGSVDLANG